MLSDVSEFMKAALLAIILGVFLVWVYSYTETTQRLC